MRYRFEFHPDPDCLTLHVDFILPRVYKCGDVGPFEAPLDEEDAAFTAELGSIDGTDRISLGSDSRYECHVVKGCLFEWGPIQRELLRIFAVRYSPFADPVEFPIETARFSEG